MIPRTMRIKWVIGKISAICCAAMGMPWYGNINPESKIDGQVAIFLLQLINAALQFRDGRILRRVRAGKLTGEIPAYRCSQDGQNDHNNQNDLFHGRAFEKVFNFANYRSGSQARARWCDIEKCFYFGGFVKPA